MSTLFFSVGSVSEKAKANSLAVGELTKSNGDPVGLVTGGKYSSDGESITLNLKIDLTEAFRNTDFASDPGWFAAMEMGNRRLHISYKVTVENPDYEVAKEFIDHHTPYLGREIPIEDDGSWSLSKGRGWYYLQLKLTSGLFAVESVLTKGSQQAWISSKFAFDGTLERNTNDGQEKCTEDELLSDIEASNVKPLTPPAPAPSQKLPAPPRV